MVGINVPVTGIWHPAVVPGQVVCEGDLLGEIVDLFGAVLQQVIAPSAGPLLYVVSSLSVREGEALIAIGDA
jgi:predicted deacylase